MKNIRKGWLFFLIFLFWAGLRLEGPMGGVSFVIVFLVGHFVVTTAIDFIYAVARVFSQMGGTHIHVNTTPGIAADGLPDIEGTATRKHPDPTRPDPDWEDEWAGAITYRLKKGS